MRLSVLALLFSAAAFAQVPTPTTNVQSDPGGSCQRNSSMQYNVRTGQYWGCEGNATQNWQNGVWTKISPANVITTRTTDPTGAACDPKSIALRTPGGALYTCVSGVYAAAGGGLPGGMTTQVQFNSSGAFAGDAGFTFDPVNGLSHALNVTDPTTSYIASFTGLNYNPTGDISNANTGFAENVDIEMNGTHNYGNGTVGMVVTVDLNGNGTYGKTYGTQSFLQQYDGTSSQLVAFWGWVGTYGGTIAEIDTFYAKAPDPAPGGGGVTPALVNQYWSDDLAGVATNGYYSWWDSRGVRRVKEDNTFDSVGQAIEALYNPQFTKYTPGAANFERVILGQWNGNVAEIGNQAGGTGTLRPLRLIGASVAVPGAGAANTAVCWKAGGVIGWASNTMGVIGTTCN